jgi:ABC-2 type transport system ATP-binding protein
MTQPVPQGTQRPAPPADNAPGANAPAANAPAANAPAANAPAANAPAANAPNAIPPDVGASSVGATSIGTPSAQGSRPVVVGLDRVSRRFEDVVAVDDVSFTVPEGAIVGVIGPSGAGKTTTIRLMTGSLAPDKGVVRVLGEDPRKFRRRTRERIGYMPQLFILYPDLTARENIDFVAALFGIPTWRRGRRVRDVLALVDLTEARNRRASQLSGGMQRRLELACALVHQPDLLILDEPTAGSDPMLRTRIWRELDRRRQTGVTVIVTTQYVTEAEYCDAVALISEGRLVAFATPADLRRMAQGGEVFEVGTREPIDARALPPMEGIVSVRQIGPRQLVVVAVDVGAATPQVNDAIEAAGATVEYSREYRPTFDEVFAALVNAHAERTTKGAEVGPGPVPQAVARPR